MHNSCIRDVKVMHWSNNTSFTHHFYNCYITKRRRIHHFYNTNPPHHLQLKMLQMYMCCKSDGKMMYFCNSHQLYVKKIILDCCLNDTRWLANPIDSYSCHRFRNIHRKELIYRVKYTILWWNEGTSFNIDD